jgi:DNA polymerase I
MAARLPKPGDPGVLYLVDLSGYVFRAYHAIAPLSNSKGEATHAVMGTVNMLQKVVNGRRPDLFAIAMDSRSPNFRKQLDVRYKAHRPPAPPDLGPQMQRCEELARAYNIPVYQQEGLEADDMIASVVKRALEDSDVQVVIVSADKDLMQLVRDDDERVLLWDSMRDRVFGPAEVREKFGVVPSKLRDLLALTGDASDNIPGVPSVGPKTAADLLNEFGSLEAVYANVESVKRAKLKESLKTHEADARISQKLVTLRDDGFMAWDRAHLKYGGANKDELRRLFAELEFTRLLDALGGVDGEGGASSRGSIRQGPNLPAPAPFTLPATSTVLDAQALAKLVVAVQTEKAFGLSIVALGVSAMSAELLGVSIGTKEHAAYIPISHRYLGAPLQLSAQAVFDQLAPLFKDASVCVSGHNLKFAEVLSSRYGLSWACKRFDVELAAYLLDPDAPKTLPQLAEREFGAVLADPLAAPPKVKGKKASTETFESLDVERATAMAAPLGYGSLALAERLSERLASENLAKLASEIEFPLEAALSRIEARGVLVDTALLALASTTLEKELHVLEQQAYVHAKREFAMRSRDQLEVILFDELELPVLKRTPKGGRSTDAEVLEDLAPLHPLPQIICDFRELDKLKGTYLDALPRYKNAHTHRIHTTFAQAVAATGRLSSTEPNLQNIPIRTKVGKDIRRAFIAPEGSSIVSADYSQIELRVLAHLSEDPELCSAFEKEEDVHVHTASLIFEVTKAEVTDEMRRRAKTINFGVIYGMGDAALAKQLRIPKETAGKFIAAYFARYAYVKRYMDSIVVGARKGEAVRTMLGRRRFLPNLHSANRGLRFEAERVAKNTPIQGTAADILKVAMVRLDETLPSPNAKMVLTVHDELVFEIPTAEVPEAKLAIAKAMSSAAELRVPLLVHVGSGPNWAEAH